MTPDSTTSLRGAREDTIDALCRRFAEDQLSLPELERRLEKARGARTRAELDALVADLRPAAGSLPASGPQAREQPARRSDARSGATRSPRRPEPGRDTVARPPVRTSSHVAFAVMGGTRRVGRWAPPANMVAVAIMGGVELDFRDAVLSGEEVEINCFAFWGAVEIVVPPDVHVDTHGFAIMGGFDQEAELDVTAPPGAPVIRINGLAIMGAVEVKVAERGTKLPKKDW